MKIFIYPLISIFFISCYSYKVFPKEYRNFQYKGEKKTAFIINPELKKEFEILKKSEIFILTDDSLNENNLKIKLLPMRKNLTFICGEPIIASVFSFGQIPVYFPDRYQFQFEEINQKDTIVKKFELDVAQQVWFWDMFVFHKNFTQKAGKALLGNYYKQITISQQ